MSKDNSGPAFPAVQHTCNNGDTEIIVSGLTKREWFAANVSDGDLSEAVEALETWTNRKRLINEDETQQDGLITVIRSRVMLRLMFADALIAELEKGQ